ncbi:MAG: hypothetical protein WD793_07860 [Steroidobacteraceae bacterium]
MNDSPSIGTLGAKSNAKPGIAKRWLLTGLFPDARRAERAYKVCLRRGYEIGAVNVVISEATRQKLIEDNSEVSTELAGREATGGDLGGPSGGRAGILITIFAAVGAAIIVPGLGLVTGPLAVALAAGGAAGLAAGLVSALGNWGVPDERIRGYEEAIRGGAILMMVEVTNDADARSISKSWKLLGGREVHRRSQVAGIDTNSSPDRD